MREGTFTVGDFTLFVSYLGWMSSLPQWVGLLLARHRQAGVAVARMERLLEGAPQGTLVRPSRLYLGAAEPALPVVARRPSDRLERLVATGLTYRHPETGRGIQGVDLDLRRGTFTVVTGRIGAGKTTLLRTLLGLVPAASGEVRWNGDVVADPSVFLVPPRCAYTPQVPRLFSDTLRENILMGLPEDRADLLAALHLAVLERDLATFEQGLDTRVGARGVKLSGGQVQRAAAARMLVRAPELLIFDDLSSALDVETERTLWERLFRLPELTCLVVSHRRAALERADHVLLLRDGRLEAEGRLEELLSSSEEMRRLWQGEGLGTELVATR
jgi:ATP-binding cassette subfamily B protein